LETQNRLSRLRELVILRDAQAVTTLLNETTGRGELVELLNELSNRQLIEFADVLGDDRFGELLGEIDPSDAAVLLSKLAAKDAADVLEAMDPDEAADVAGEIEPEDVDRILIEMEPVEAAELRDLLSYPPDTAGGRMTPAYVSIAPDIRADQAVVALRQLAEEAETLSYVYVTEADNTLLGVLSLRRLIFSRPSTLVTDLMATDPITVPVTADQEVAALMLNEHDLLALPVIDENNRLLGIITVDDVADILEQEATEDIARLGGSQPLEEPYLRASPFHLWRKRIVWLMVLFVAQAYTGTVLAYYEDVLEAVTVLVFFMPLLIGTGGNAGSQVVTTLVRAMAVGDVQFRDIFRIVFKELQTGVLLGIVMATAVFFRALMLGVGVDIGLVVALTITAIVIWAVTVGAILPLILRQLRVDPAVVSAPFIATLVDGTGLIIYFTVAGLILGLNS
jgi:magnesium transporter